MKLESIFTTDLDRCFVTKQRGRIEIHHVFGAANRKRSTEYAFVVPLLAEIHPNGASASDKACRQLTGRSLKEIDAGLKRACQRYYEVELGKTREEFIEEFGRSYL